jgi:hypothetical protein
MASDVDNSACRVADWISETSKANDGICMLRVSNVLWVIWGEHADAYALIILQFCLFVMNLRGFKKNFKVQKNSSLGRMGAVESL